MLEILRHHNLAKPYAIAEQRHLPAIVQPGGGSLRVLEKVQHGLLVVAHQEDRIETLQRLANQQFKHLAGLSTPINVVAEIYHGLAAIVAGGIFPDHVVQFLEQIQATMNIANAIQAAARLQGRVNCFIPVTVNMASPGFISSGPVRASQQSPQKLFQEFTQAGPPFPPGRQDRFSPQGHGFSAGRGRAVEGLRVAQRVSFPRPAVTGRAA